MPEEYEDDGLSLRVKISRKTIIGLAFTFGGGSLGAGLYGVGVLGSYEAALARLESCQSTQQQCNTTVRKYEDFTAEALPILARSKDGTILKDSAGLPAYFRPSEDDFGPD